MTQKKDFQVAHWAARACKDKHIRKSSRPAQGYKEGEISAECHTSQGLDTGLSIPEAVPQAFLHSLHLAQVPFATRKDLAFPGRGRHGMSGIPLRQAALGYLAGQAFYHVAGKKEACPVFARLSHFSNQRAPTMDTKHHRTPRERHPTQNPGPEVSLAQTNLSIH